MNNLILYRARGNGKSFLADYIRYILRMNLLNSLDDIYTSNYVNRSEYLLIGYIIKNGRY